ncbi:MAG: efflux RND transporter periplasmic adaptor subunit, partial [Deltaproteobacteria bacterium]|nr:efflux RND transporter periplasmic adaptor subunit [Deltaproteobacteria bacterium]
MLARLLLVPVVFIGALGGATGCKKPAASDAAKKAAPAAPVKVVTVTATEAPTPDVLTLTGIVVADQRSEVTADTQGKVVAVMVERGQRVRMGDPMIRLDVRNAALSAREARANLESARAQKRLAEEECKRAKSLFDKGAITRSEFDRQNTQCTSALQSVSAAEARTEMIAKSVNDGVVRAPFEGEVAERMVSPGEWVAPGRALFTLVDDDPLRIELSVPEIAVSAVREGQGIELRAVARPGVYYKATISRLGAEIGKTRSLIVEAKVDPQAIP